MNAVWRESLKKRTRKFAIAFVIMTAMLVGFTYMEDFSDKPAFIINDYYVIVKPMIDGSLQVDYSVYLTTINAKSRNSLTTRHDYVNLDMLGLNYEVMSFGGMAQKAVTKDLVESGMGFWRHESMVETDGVGLALNRYMAVGEQVHVTLSVKQTGVLHQKNQEYYYDFMPGWSRTYEIENYQVLWLDDGGIVSDNVDDYWVSDKGERFLVWQGNGLKQGQLREITVNYAAQKFTHPQVTPRKKIVSYQYNIKKGIDSIVEILVVLLFMFALAYGDLYYTLILLVRLLFEKIANRFRKEKVVFTWKDVEERVTKSFGKTWKLW
jgi:hypothetical protein